MAIKLIIGLQNPGQAYENTRHNAGGWFVAALAKHHHASFKLDKKLHAELAELELDGHSCKLALPTTFMNHSGQPARAISQFYKISPEEILVVHDELDISVGRAKLKQGGGHGGHNGLRDIAAQLGSTNFLRLRLGIGHPGHKDLVHSFVLSKPSAHDKQFIYDAIERSLSVIPLLLSGNTALAMNQLHT